MLGKGKLMRKSPLLSNIQIPKEVIMKSFLKQNVDVQIVLVALFFYASACLGYFLTFTNTTALPTWPPSGIGFALIILLGRAAWPGITIGALIANLMAHWNTPSLPVFSIISISAFIAIANTIEVLAGNYMLKRWVKSDYPFRNARGAFQFLFTTIFMCVFGSLISTVALYLNNAISGEDILRVGMSSWIGDVVGILLFTPFILSCAQKNKIKLSQDKLVEILMFILFFVGIITVLKIDHFQVTLQRALPFLILPFLLWLAFRFELLVAMAAVLAVSLLSIYFTIRGSGPFVLTEPYHSMLLLQIFIGVMSISTIVLSATVKERIEAERNLVEFNETLEAKVQERTSLLHDEIASRKLTEENLQRTNSELSKRNSELDNFVYSVSHDLRAPIASVLGLINLAKKDHDVAMKDVYLELINKSAVQQDHFIKEILDQSRNSRLEIKREEILFQPMIEETFNQLKFASPNGQVVTKIVKVTQNKPFFSDRWRLKVILNNIISNSIRYRNGKDPVIEVNVDVNDDYALLQIQDNGKGIGKEHLENVCRMFYRATDDGAGSGLGLYIVKEAIDKLNGSFAIDSEIGKGTTVVMQIPEVLN
jgi:signal transduction histidine kinase